MPSAIEILLVLFSLSLWGGLLFAAIVSTERRPKVIVGSICLAWFLVGGVLVMVSGVRVETKATTAYVRSSPTRYVWDEFSLEYTRSGGVEAYIKGELGERQVHVDRVITHHDKTDLVVDGDDVTLYLHQ